MTLARQVIGDFMQSITAEENIKSLKITGVITWVKRSKMVNFKAALLKKI